MTEQFIAYHRGLAPAGADAVALYEALGVVERLRSSRTVFIKLNLCAAQRYEAHTGVCVDTQAVIALVQSLRSIAPDARYMVGDSDSTGFGFAHDKFRFQGLPSAAAAHAFELVDLSRDETVLVHCGGDFYEAVPLAKSVAEADFFVSLSKIKTHNITRVTGNLKNAFGLLPQGEKKKLHPYLDTVLADIHRAKPPNLCALDGKPAMEGNGPIHGTPVELDLTLYGNDALATDMEMSRLIGIEPRGVGHLKHLAKQLGRDIQQEIELVGAMPRPRITPFVEPPGSQRRLIWTGLRIQSLGANIEEVGHLVHFAQKLGDIQKVKRFLARAFRKGRIF